MQISLELLLDELGLTFETAVEAGVNPKCTSAELYCSGESYSPGTLLVCPLAEALAAKQGDGLFFLCAGDIESSAGTACLPGNIVLVTAAVGLRDLYNRVQRVFLKITRWILAMERSTARRGGFQELLDLAEPIFRNLITVQDSTFKLLSHTKNIVTTDAVMNRLLQYGYHPEENMELFRRHRRLEQFRTQTEIIVSTDNLTSEHDIVKKTFTADGAIHFILVMDCNARPASPALIELFEILVEYVQAYIDLEIAQTGGNGGAKSLALDLINKSVASREEAEIRSAHCAYPFEGNFRLCLFSFEDEINVPMALLLRSLAGTCVRGVAFSRDKHVLLLGTEGPDMRQFHTNILNVLNSMDFRCGISEKFACLWDLPVAYGQARIALEVSAKLKPDVARAKSSPRQAKAAARRQSPEVTRSRDYLHPFHFAFFSELFVHHIVSTACQAAPEVYAGLFGKNAVEKLRAYDRRHNTDTMFILRKYLECERRATVAAEMLHMHRNTVLYHVEKIERLLDISLEDADTRLWLQLAFTADDLA